MNVGIKLAKPGNSVVDMSSPAVTNEEEKRKLLPHLLYAVAFTYLHGAKTQVGRYREAVKYENAVTRFHISMHEASCLFEDLTTIAKYTQMCGDDNKLNSLWVTVRNHIRHDVREAVDAEDDRKAKRAKKLGIDPKLQMQIGLGEDAIKVGSVIIQLSEIEEYIGWAEAVMEKTLKEAVDKGYVKGMTYEGA